MENKKEINKKLWIKWALVILWMIVIFIFSKDPAVVSDGKSDFVIRFLSKVGIDLNGALGSFAVVAVRKGAHLSEYFILYLLLYLALKESLRGKSTYIAALIITYSYALSDEIHQLFVIGRAGKLTDVFIDTLGGVLCAIVILLVNYIVKKINKIKKEA